MSLLPEPLYATPDGSTQSSHRLLLVSYHFPPDPSIGARRWEKLAHYVAQRGWGLDVIMRREQPITTPADLARLKGLPSGVRIYGVPLPALAIQRTEQRVWSLLRGSRTSAPPGQMAAAPPTRAGVASQPSPAAQAGTAASVTTPPLSFAVEDLRWSLLTPRGWLRMYWSWLDFAQVQAWGTGVVQLARAIVRPDVHLAIVSSGPPHMSHDAGRRISKLTGLPFVMDMRDPWRNAERLSEATASPFWLHLASRYEGKAVRQASLIAANTELARRAMQRRYPTRQADIITAMNGADADPIPPSRRRVDGAKGKFAIAHAGTVYLDRDPRGLFQAAARVVHELQLTPDQFALEFIGELEAVGGFPIRDVAEQEGIADYVQTGPPRPHAEAMQFMADATMLVTMSGNSIAAIPAKTFECIRFEAWVLALSASGSATDLLLQGTDADVLAPTDVDGIAAAIKKRYEQYAAGVLPRRIANDDDDRFSRRGQANVLLDAIASRIKQV